jgi:hypothetical protein
LLGVILATLQCPVLMAGARRRPEMVAR